MGTILTILLAVSLVFGGAGATVYAAQDSLPGETLYPVKTASEAARMQMTGDETAKFDLALQFAHQRMQEYKALVQSGEPVTEPFMNAFQNQWQEALQRAGDMEDDEELLGALERARVQLRLQEQTCTMLQQNQPEEVEPSMTRIRTMLQAQLRRVEAGLEDPAMFRARVRTGVPEDVEPGPVETPPGPPEEPGGGTGGEPQGEPQGEPKGFGPEAGPQDSPGPELGAGPQNGSDNPVGPGSDDTGSPENGGSPDNGGGNGGSQDNSGGDNGGDNGGGNGGSNGGGGGGGGGGGKK